MVCSSRPHAVRFWQALRKHSTDHGYDLGVLVAFSDAITVNGDEPVTEEECNGFPESQTAERFNSDAYQIMVVAEKFQAGFDQPKLYAIYVDKTLNGLAAVQTLSRFNRTHPDEDGTFVLDFVNDANDVAAAFGRSRPRQPWSWWTGRRSAVAERSLRAGIPTEQALLSPTVLAAVTQSESIAGTSGHGGGVIPPGKWWMSRRR